MRLSTIAEIINHLELPPGMAIISQESCLALGDKLLEIDAEIERLRRVEQAAKNMIKWWEDSGLIYNCGPVEEIRAALEEK